MRPSLSRSRILITLVCLLPLAAICLAVATRGVDVLRWDEWMVYGRMIERLDAGTFSPENLIAQQNEQRLASARVFGLALMPLTHLDRFPEFGLNVALAAIIFGLTALLYRRTARRLGLTALWPYPVFAFLCFSFCQWEGFLTGISNTLHMPVLCMLLAVLIADSPRLGPGRFLALAAVCFAGSFHFANGLFTWFCVAPLLMAAAIPLARKALYLGLFALATAGTWLLYFHDFHLPAHHPSVLSFLSEPRHCITYFFTYLGSPLFAGRESPLPATAIGLGGMGMLIINSLLLVRGGERMRRFLLPWLSVAGFTLLSALSTSVGRGGFPLSQALESRYVTFSTPLWSAMTAMAAAALLAKDRPWVLCFRSVQRMVLIILMISFAASAFMSMLLLNNREPNLHRGRAELFCLTNTLYLQQVFPDPAYLEVLIPRFFERRLTVFRDVGRLDEYELAPPDPGAGRVTGLKVNPWLDSANRHGGVLVTGWAADPAGGAAQWVLVVCNGRIAYATTTGKATNALGAPADSGFEVFLPWFFLDADARAGQRLDIEVYVVPQGRTMLQLPSDADLSVTVEPRPEPEFVYPHFFLST